MIRLVSGLALAAGALAAIVVGTLANDSAAIVFMIGATLILATCGVAYAAHAGTTPSVSEGTSGRRDPAIT